jgi:restriction system protein
MLSGGPISSSPISSAFSSAFSTAFGSGGPSLVLQAVVDFGSRTPEGQLVIAIAPAWFEIIEVIKTDAELLFRIPPRKLEEMIAAAYERRGFTVTLTPRSGDYGRDVIAEKSGWGAVRFIDQVKAYRPGHVVTADEVRAVLGVLHGDQKANKGIVTTTSDFAPRISDDPYIKPFVPTRLELIDGANLRKQLIALGDLSQSW